MRITSATIFALFSSILFIACQSSSTSPQQSSGKTFVFARPGDNVGFDPARNHDGESVNTLTNIFENLVFFKAGSLEIEPLLAESWTVSDDGKTYTFKLRPNVKFHDGTDFNAEAVVFSVERQRSKEHPAYAFLSPYPWWDSMGMGDVLDNVKAIDPLTVQFNLKAPNAPFIANLAMPFMAIVSPTAVLKLKTEFDQNPVGTGPYVLESWKKDDALVLRRNDNYWGSKPKVDRVVMRVIPDNQVRFLELKRGSIHAMDYPNPSDVSELKADPNVNVLEQEGLNIGYLSFNMNRKPFDSLEVRLALSMAIDRDRIISEIYEGFGVKAKNPMPPQVLGYNKAVPEIEYNPEKAKELLKKAGIENLETSIWAMPVARPYNPNARKMAEFIQADLKRIGVNAKIVSYDWGTYLEKVGNGEHDMMLIGWTGDNGDPDNFLDVLWSIESSKARPTNNYSFYEDETVNSWLKKAKTVTNLTERAKIYEDIQMKLFNDRPFLPIAHSKVLVPVRANVKGYNIYPMGDRIFKDVEFLESDS